MGIGPELIKFTVSHAYQCTEACGLQTVALNTEMLTDSDALFSNGHFWNV